MKYEQLSQTDRDDLLAEALYSREMEHFQYAFDKANFERLLENLPLGDYRTDLEARLASTTFQMACVENIHKAITAQIADAEAHAAAIARTGMKRELTK